MHRSRALFRERGRRFVPRVRLGRAKDGIAAITTGTAAGQAVALIAAPILSRVYSPSDFGAFASLLALVAIASTAGSLRLESAVPIASEIEARDMVRTAALSALVAGLICAGILAVTGHHVFAQQGWLGAGLVTYLVWVGAMYTVLTAFSLRERKYNAVAQRNFLQSVGKAVGQLFLSPWLNSGTGLAVGFAMGRSLGVASLVRESGMFSKDARGPIQKQLITLRRYWRFPVVFMPSGLLNVLGAQLPLLLVTRSYGAASAGNLAQALTFGAIPAALMGSAISSVVMAEMAARVRAGELNQRARYMRVTRALLPIGLGWLLLMLIGSPIILPWVLGPEWSESGAFSSAFAAAASAGLIVSPLTVVFDLYERALLSFMLDLGRVVLVGCLGAAAWKSGQGPAAAVAIMSLGMAAVYAAIWLLALRTVSVGQSSRGESSET